MAIEQPAPRVKGKFTKGAARAQGAGRRKGSPNRNSAYVTSAMLLAAERLGAQDLKAKGKLDPATQEAMVEFFESAGRESRLGLASLIIRSTVPRPQIKEDDGNGPSQVVNVTIASVPSGNFLSQEEARSAMGLPPGGPVLTMTPGVRIGEPPGPPKLVVIDATAEEVPPPADEPPPTVIDEAPPPPPPPAPRTANNTPAFEFSRSRRRPFEFK